MFVMDLTLMQIDSKTSLLENIRFLPSPNFDQRPAGTQIDLLVVHGISLPPGKFGGPAIDALFTNQLDSNADPYFKTIANLKVASHVLIRRDGSLTQYVPFAARAWHAGESSFQGRGNCNDFSIGVELEGTDTVPYENIQYQQLAQLTRALMQSFPAIMHDRIVGHSDIAPGRKTDPGAVFDWQYFFKLLTDN